MNELDKDLNRLISDVIYKENEEGFRNGFDEPLCTATEYLAEILTEKLTEAGWRKQNEWISVDERLPERQGYYLGCTYKGLMMIAPFFPVYADDKPEFRYDISHWMPLPEAPKMKGGAE